MYLDPYATDVMKMQVRNLITRLIQLQFTKHSFVFSALGDNLHSIAQMKALTGQIVNDVNTTHLGDCLLKHPSNGYYQQLLDDADPSMDRDSQGTFL